MNKIWVTPCGMVHYRKPDQEAKEYVSVEPMPTVSGRPVSRTNNYWKPIETAPRDGMRILLSDPYNGVGDGYYCNMRWWHYECGDDWYSEEWSPTHWMPLPAAPKAGE